MIDLHAYATPNSVKVPILLEELGADYRLTKIDIRAGEQKAPVFLALNPNGNPIVCASLCDAAAESTIEDVQVLAGAGGVAILRLHSIGFPLPVGRASRIEADRSVGKYRRLARIVAPWRRKDGGSPSRTRTCDHSINSRIFH